MGKVGLAYDQITQKENIQELSVVLYPDSFFYGLWTGDSVLSKTGYHPMESLEAILKLSTYYYSLSSLKVISTLKPYVHLWTKHKDPNYFNIYFDGIYNLELLEEVQPTSDDFSHEKKVTLHYLPEEVSRQFMAFDMTPEYAHISTSLANYMHLTKIDLVCFLSGRTIHLCVRKNGFAYYNQYDCFYNEDYIYFLALIREAFLTNDVKVHVCGEVNKSGTVLKQLKKYFSNLSIIDAALLLPKKVSHNPTQFFDLYLCKSCVS